MSEELKVDVGFSFTLDTVIGTTYKMTSVDDYRNEPLTIADAIVERAAQIVVERLIREGNGYQTLRDQVGARIKELIDERVQPMVEDVLVSSIPLTNSYGEATGKTTTIRELVIAEAGKQLKPAGDNYGSRKSTFSEVLSKTVESVVKRELEAEVEAAKATLKAKLAASVGAVLSDAVVAGVTR